MDQSALSSVGLAAIFWLVAAAIALADLFATPALSIVTGTTGTSGTSVSIDLTALSIVVALGLAEFILVLLAVWVLRGAFQSLSSTDQRFSTPATLTLLLLIAAILAAVVLVALFAVVYQAVLCAGSGNAITSSCISVGEALGLVALLVVTGIVALVGFIGLLIGVWRLGTRYGEGMFKAAAILMIFPVLNLAGAVLIFVACRSVRGRLGTYAPPPAFG